jgi:thiamine-monophosphate kinase
MTLRDVGERYLLEHIVPEFCSSAGDDCGRIDIPQNELLITTDPVPIPAAYSIGGDPDPYWMGWLLVIINVSDLAASGSKPLGFVSALEAEPSRTIEELRRLLSGIRDACASEGIKHVGGNLREGLSLGGVGTAVGISKPGASWTRSGARDGDVLLSLGQGGLFWRDALQIWLHSNQPADKRSSPVFAPRTQIQITQQMAKTGKVHAAIDNSDGLFPSVQQLVVKSGLSATIDLDCLTVPGASAEVDPARLWLGWGDWNVIVAVEPNEAIHVAEIANGMGSCAIPIGTVHKSIAEPILLVQRGNKKQFAPRLESERFAVDSWFLEGISGYIDRLMAVELPT